MLKGNVVYMIAAVLKIKIKNSFSMDQYTI